MARHLHPSLVQHFADLFTQARPFLRLGPWARDPNGVKYRVWAMGRLSGSKLYRLHPSDYLPALRLDLARAMAVHIDRSRYGGVTLGTVAALSGRSLRTVHRSIAAGRLIRHPASTRRAAVFTLASAIRLALDPGPVPSDPHARETALLWRMIFAPPGTLPASLPAYQDPDRFRKLAHTLPVVPIAPPPRARAVFAAFTGPELRLLQGALVMFDAAARPSYADPAEEAAALAFARWQMDLLRHGVTATLEQAWNLTLGHALAVVCQECLSSSQPALGVALGSGQYEAEREFMALQAYDMQHGHSADINPGHHNELSLDQFRRMAVAKDDQSAGALVHRRCPVCGHTWADTPEARADAHRQALANALALDNQLPPEDRLGADRARAMLRHSRRSARSRRGMVASHSISRLARALCCTRQAAHRAYWTALEKPRSVDFNMVTTVLQNMRLLNLDRELGPILRPHVTTAWASSWFLDLAPMS